MGVQNIDLDQALFKGDGGSTAVVKSIAEYALLGERRVYKQLSAALEPIVDRHLEAAAQGRLEGTEVIASCINWRLRRAGGDIAKVDKDLILLDIIFLSMAANSNLALTAAWVLTYNLRDPELRRRQQKEFDDIFGAGDAFAGFTLEGLERCHLLQATMLEVFRLKNPGSSIRLLLEELQFSSGIVVPAGHMLATNRYFNSRDTAYFEDPEKFDVDRHMPGTNAATQRACDEGRFTPWGRGTHVCVGRRFANMQITLFVAHVLRKFDAELVDPSAHIAVDPRQAGFFISRPTHPVWMKLHRRNSGEPKQIVSVEAELHDPSAQMLQLERTIRGES